METRTGLRSLKKTLSQIKQNGVWKMGWFDDLLRGLANSITETLRKFTAYSMILFFIGAVYGFYIIKISNFTGVDQLILLALPLVLAGLAYVSTAVAAILFAFLLILVLLVFF